MSLFMGSLKRHMEIFLLGEISETPGDENIIILKNIVRVIEIADEKGNLRFTMHPDMFFTSDDESKVMLSDFLVTRKTDDEQDPAYKSYLNFMMNLRLKKSGIVTGIQHAQERKILQDSGL